MEGTLWAFPHTYKSKKYTYTLVYKSIIYVGIYVSNEMNEFQYYLLKSIPSYLWIFSPWTFHETHDDWKQLHYQGLLVNGCVKIPEVKVVTAAPHITLHFSSTSQHRAEVIF